MSIRQQRCYPALCTIPDTQSHKSFSEATAAIRWYWAGLWVTSTGEREHLFVTYCKDFSIWSLGACAIAYPCYTWHLSHTLDGLGFVLLISLWADSPLFKEMITMNPICQTNSLPVTPLSGRRKVAVGGHSPTVNFHLPERGVTGRAFSSQRHGVSKLPPS